MRFFLLFFSVISTLIGFAQDLGDEKVKKWVDSVYNSLNEDERIGQLIVTRLSTIDAKTKKITSLFDQTADLVKKYNIGGVCVFQGSPVTQAKDLNRLKSMAKTPLLISIDGEWGVGMRITDSVVPLPRQMMLGAMGDPWVIYDYGKLVAEQCKRLGIQMNYAPVVDVNNNPNNPVINDRSFGEDKEKVATFGIAYMKGMQENGVMACAKHFPGHGDVAVDSHLDLPEINKRFGEIDSTELYPFKKIFAAGIGSVMVGHLYIPAIDSSANRPTSLSSKNIQGLLRGQLGYKGIAITDGLEMQGVKKFFPGGEASVESIIAGNDMLCLPDSIHTVIEKIKLAIQLNRIKMDDIEKHCKKVLYAKYNYVLNNNDTIALNNLTADLNSQSYGMRKKVALNALTLLANKDEVFFPLKQNSQQNKIAYIGIGINKENAFARRMKKDYAAEVFLADFNLKNADSLKYIADSIGKNFAAVVIGIHQIYRAPANNFGISATALEFIKAIQSKCKTMLFLFGNAYAAKNWCDANNLAVCYEDDSIVQNITIDMLQGKLPYKGVLPVSVCDQYKFGYGINNNLTGFPFTSVQERLLFKQSAIEKIDSTINDAMQREAMPGASLLVLKDGKTLLDKSYGFQTYQKQEPISGASVYDLASLTKMLSTTLAVMKLYEEGKIKLNKTVSTYLPQLKKSNKSKIKIEQLLLHEAGLQPYIPFYKELLGEDSLLKKEYYQETPSINFSNEVTKSIIIRNDILDSFMQRVVTSPVSKEKNYVYSDIDFILLGKIVEAVSKMPLEKYVHKNFYQPMGLKSIGYRPLRFIAPDRIVPSTRERIFRNGELKGYVHDQGAALMNGIAGHAGLFADTYDVGAIMQMLVNGGAWNGKSFFKKETVSTFTAYHSKISRRGLGFDKPEKDNASRAEPYPALSCAAETFGHTGFTGTCAWADPVTGIVFVFLSNRIYDEEKNAFKSLNLRPKLLEFVYQGLVK
jgi:beta-N-acetylhexosaminidase